jgi:hypothetical protein
MLSHLLIEMGYRISSNNYDYKVQYTLDWQKQYLKVPGFEKYRFSFNLYSYNSSRQKIGHLLKNIFTSGRNFNQCFKKAKQQFRDYLQKNINKMNLD